MHSVPDSVGKPLFLKGIEKVEKYVRPEIKSNLEDLKTIVKSNYRQNKISHSFCSLSGNVITVDVVKLYYLSIYKRIHSLMQKTAILREVAKERARKSNCILYLTNSGACLIFK